MSLTQFGGSLSFDKRNIGGALNLGNVVVGSDNYEDLTNKPSIEGHTLIGDSLLGQIGVGLITPQEIDQLIYG